MHNSAPLYPKTLAECHELLDELREQLQSARLLAGHNRSYHWLDPSFVHWMSHELTDGTLVDVQAMLPRYVKALDANTLPGRGVWPRQ
jgi:predicted deacetylase